MKKVKGICIFIFLLSIFGLVITAIADEDTKTEPESALGGHTPMQDEATALEEELIENLNKAIEIEPDNAALYYLRVKTYLLTHENEIKDLDTAISLKPDIALFYFARGTAYERIKQHKEAINDFSKAITLKPDTLKNLRLLFKKVDEKLGKFEEIFEDYHPNNYLAEFFYQRGRIYEENGQIAEAIKDYEQAIITYPEIYVSFIFLADNYAQVNRLEDGIKFYSKVISQRPKDANPYHERAYIFQILKQYEKAIKDYSKAIELDPEGHSGDYINRAYVYEDMKQYDKAIKDYSKAIELEPNRYVGYYYIRGIAYREMKQYWEAEADFQRACDLTENVSFKKKYCNDLKKFKKEIARGEKWIKWSQSGDTTYFYDKTSIRKQPNKHIRVWIRTEEEDIPAYIEKRKTDSQTTEGYENYSHSLTAWEYDCNSANMATTSSVEYDDKGKDLYSYDVNEKTINWKAVIPDSIGYFMFKIACKGEDKKD